MSAWDRIASWGQVPQVGAASPAANGIVTNQGFSDPTVVQGAATSSQDSMLQRAASLLHSLTGGAAGAPVANGSMAKPPAPRFEDYSIPQEPQFPRMMQLDLPYLPSDPGIVARPSGPPQSMQFADPVTAGLASRQAALRLALANRAMMNPGPFGSSTLGMPTSPIPPNGSGSQ